MNNSNTVSSSEEEGHALTSPLTRGHHRRGTGFTGGELQPGWRLKSWTCWGLPDSSVEDRSRRYPAPVNSEDWAALGAVIAGVAALIALYFAWRSARASLRSAHAAEEQTKIQRQLRIDAAQPYVWVDIRADHAQGTRLNLVVGNSGPTVAEKVRVKVDPALPASDQYREGVKIAQAILTEGIESLPPGRTLVWALGMAFDLMKDGKVPQSYKFTVTANGPFGQVPALTYIVDMGNWRESQDQPDGSLFQLTKAVEKLTKQITQQS
jgi:hypothetical protein